MLVLYFALIISPPGPARHTTQLPLLGLVVGLLTLLVYSSPCCVDSLHSIPPQQLDMLEFGSLSAPTAPHPQQAGAPEMGLLGNQGAHVHCDGPGPQSSG